MKRKILKKIKDGLIVSCQALPDEPLNSPFIMGRMAYAAMLGGASGIRANTIEDITEIKKTVNIPIIGIIKKNYLDCKVYITPTILEIDALASCGCDIIAMDATIMPRPEGKTLDEMFTVAREKYPDQLFMADCSTYEEGMHAAEIGFDIVATTMSSYTPYTKDVALPNYYMMSCLSKDCGKPVIAEGGIWTPEQLRLAMHCGIWAVVVGSAITRPMLITNKFIDVLDK